MENKLVPLGAAVLTACLALTACSSSSSSESRQSKAKDCQTADPNAAVANADRSAILRYGDAPASSLDPIRQVEGSEVTVLRTIYDTLVDLEGDTPVPGLATKWEMVDARHMQFTLRSDVVFQDGTAFDSDSVKFNLERAKSDPDSTIQAQLSTVKSVEVVDRHTVVLELDPANPGALPLTLTGRAGMMVSPTAVKAAGSSEAFSEDPVGAGPYAVEGTWRPVESIKVRAWDGYWNADERLLGGIDFTRLSLDASVTAMKSGDLDMQVVASGDVESLCGEEKLRVAFSPTNGLRVFLMNSGHAPFDDLRVRQAIAHAIDRVAVAKVITNGLSEATHQWFREGQPAYDPGLESEYNYDPEKAKELLAEAGYSATNPLKFRAEIGTGAATYQRTGELIQSELAKVGVVMDLGLVDRNAIVGRYYGLGGEEIKVWSSPLGAAATVQPSERFSKHFFKDGALNPSRQEIAGLRELVVRADSTVDEKERASLLQKASSLVTSELVGGVPLFFEPGLTAYADYVGGVTRGAFNDDLRFDGVYITKDRASVGAKRS